MSYPRYPPILPAPIGGTSERRPSRQDSESDGFPSRDGSSKGSKGSKGSRQKVTPVACQPCQVRKSKCDGQRPTCGSCLNKNRIDCVYDSAGDKRRTAALKEKNRQMSEENRLLHLEITDLKDIIAIMSRHHDRDAIFNLVSPLPSNNFEDTAQVAEACREESRRAPEGGLSQPTRGGYPVGGPSLNQPSIPLAAFYSPTTYGRVMPNAAAWQSPTQDGEEGEEERFPDDWTGRQGYRDGNWPYDGR